MERQAAGLAAFASSSRREYLDHESRPWLSMPSGPGRDRSRTPWGRYATKGEAEAGGRTAAYVPPRPLDPFVEIAERIARDLREYAFKKRSALL